MGAPLLRFASGLLALAGAASGQVTRLPSPAPDPSGEPSLCETEDGRVLLSWVEPVEDGHALRFAALDGDGWAEPRTVAQGARWFVNWADFPQLVEAPGGGLAAHWRAMRGEGTYEYDVMIARAAAGAEAFGAAFRPHEDGVAAEHGFVSMVPLGADRLGVVWLDGREMPSGGSMTLRYVECGPDGELERAALLDPRVCECCQTAMARSSRGLVVVYRDRSKGEIRDIGLVRQVDGVWTEPRTIGGGNWNIPGCPVNGPSIAASADRVAVAWFTAADGRARVQLARSVDAGETFGEPTTIDGVNPVGRVSIRMLGDGTVVACWLGVEGKDAVVRVQEFPVEGEPGPVVPVAVTKPSRSTGFPQLAVDAEGLVVAWTDGGVRTARVRLPHGR
jgi:hypothetical protein